MIDIAQGVWNMLATPSTNHCECSVDHIEPVTIAGTQYCQHCHGVIDDHQKNAYDRYNGFAGYDEVED